MSTLSLNRAVQFLLASQDNDGCWRDYQLEVGRSDCWTTAVVGYALAKALHRGAELDAATKALQRLERTGGWGYNVHTACDADSSAWVIRFLAQMKALADIDVEKILSGYIISENFKARTFLLKEKFGSWAWEHDEVTPMVGMALLSAGEFNLAMSIRKAVTAAADWQNFWWQCPSYVAAANLRFLQESGGIPAQICKREAEKLKSRPVVSSSFDLAQRNTMDTLLTGNTNGISLAGSMQLPDGSWPASAELLVPDQRDGKMNAPHWDDKRLISTASMVISLLQMNGVAFH